MNSFLQQVACSLMEQIEWKQLSNTTLVLPSHRAGLVLKNELLRLQKERHAQAVWAPDVKTLPQLQDTLSPLYAEDELFTIVRLYRHYRQLNAGDPDLMPLDMFYGWGRQMLADFTNIDASMTAAEVPNFFENTIAAHELEQWQLDDEVRERLSALINSSSAATVSGDSIRAQYEHLWQQLYELYTALQAELRAEQKGYAGLRQRAVIEEWESEALQTKIAGRTYVFVGFNYLLPVERELMLRLRDAGQAKFYWDYVPNFETNEKAFSFAQLNAGILGAEALERTAARESIPVTLISCVSREAQAQYVHRWLQENYTAKGQKVGVVICDETMLESVIYTLPPIRLEGQEETEPINITKGFPLRNTAVYARALAWLNDRQRGEANVPVSPDLIEELLNELFPVKDVEEPLISNSLTSNPLSWKELLILESEYQVRKIANKIRKLLTDGLGDVPFTLKLLRLLLRRTMESVTMPFHGEPVTDIQVMGVLETRLLDFDKLLLLNVEEGVIPQKQQDLSFIPFYLRKAYHMQTSDEKATIYAYNFFRLLSRAGHSTLMYATAETAEGGKGQSRFIMQMSYSPEFNVEKCSLEEPSVLAAVTALPVVTEQPITLEKLSPSGLNTFITCPRSFYLQYVQKIHPLEDEDALFESNTLGSFVHLSMEYIYRHYFHCDGVHPVRVLPDEIEAIRTDDAKLQEALMAAYESMGEAFVPAHHAGENVIITGYVQNILERDREDAKVGLQIWQLERHVSFRLTLSDGKQVEVGGTIDRLDIYGAPGEERLRVVDYKSGNYSDTTHAKKMSAAWEEMMEDADKGYVRQTLIYSHAARQHDRSGLPIEPNLFFCRKKLTDIVTTIDVENETVHDYAAIEEKFIETLRFKVQQLLSTTEWAMCDEDKCPSFCPFFELCGRQPKEF